MNNQPIEIAVTYRDEWDDGFGARGWKLDDSLDDPDVIAATADTGNRIPTSVLVHDILDHYLCGLPLSGHRNEAVALIQLATRTGSSPAPDFASMVDEDLLHGRVNGESMRTFLPADLLESLPANDIDDREIIALLRQQLDEQALRERLIAHFFDLGEAGMEKVQSHWKAHGLAYHRRAAMGLALQRILEHADKEVFERMLQEVHGHFLVSDMDCTLRLTQPVQRFFQTKVS